MGKKNAVFSLREMFRSKYVEKLDKILLREMGRVKYILYKNGDKYLIHLKVPSEVIEKFYYDTVIEFYTDDDNIKLGGGLENYFVKFYSNDPAYVYTFAHAFLKNDLFIKDLEPRMSKLALEHRAKIKNPKDVVGYVKSIYFAWLIIKNYGLMRKVNFDTYGQKYDLKLFLNTIEPADSKVEKRKEAGKELIKKQSIEKKKEANKKDVARNQDIKSPISKNIKTTSVINNKIKINSNIRSTKKVGLSKKK
jgi:hypothetical protein